MQFKALISSLGLLCLSASAWILPRHNTDRRSLIFATSTIPASGEYTLDGEEIRGPITPVGNFILVKVKDTLTATAGGILLPDQSKERHTEGLVVAAGPGKIHPFSAVRIHNPIKEGMSVVYGKYDAKEISATTLKNIHARKF